MEDGGHIAGWDPTPGKARNDYYVRLASAQALDQELLAALQAAFGSDPAEVNYVDFEVAEQADELLPRTVIRRGGVVVTACELTAIRRV